MGNAAATRTCPRQAAETCATDACTAAWLQTQGGPDLMASGHHSSSHLSSGTLLPKAGGNKGNPACGPTGVSGTPLSLRLLWDGQGSAQTRQLRNPGVESTHHPEQAELAASLQEHPSHSQDFSSVFVNKTNAPENKTGTSLYTVDEKSEKFSCSVARALCVPKKCSQELSVSPRPL